jgi:hypothetical protein
MNFKIAASLVVLASLGAAPALAQAPAAAPAAASAKLSVETTPIGDIVKNPKAKAALEATMPQITQYYDQIGQMTLKQVQPMSQGAITDDMLKKIQADFDKINAGG